MNSKRKTGKSIKTEFLIFTVCLLTSFGFVLFSVLKYDNGLKDLISQLHIVLLGGLALYFLLLIFRLVFWVLVKIIQ